MHTRKLGDRNIPVSHFLKKNISKWIQKGKCFLESSGISLEMLVYARFPPGVAVPWAVQIHSCSHAAASANEPRFLKSPLELGGEADEPPQQQLKLKVYPPGYMLTSLKMLSQNSEYRWKGLSVWGIQLPWFLRRRLSGRTISPSYPFLKLSCLLTERGSPAHLKLSLTPLSGPRHHYRTQLFSAVCFFSLLSLFHLLFPLCLTIPTAMTEAEILKVLNKYTEINQQVSAFLLRGTQPWEGLLRFNFHNNCASKRVCKSVQG